MVSGAVWHARNRPSRLQAKLRKVSSMSLKALSQGIDAVSCSRKSHSVMRRQPATIRCLPPGNTRTTPTACDCGKTSGSAASVSDQTRTL